MQTQGTVCPEYTKSQTEKFKSLMSLASLVNSSLDACDILYRSIDAAKTLLNAEEGSMIMIDRTTNELYFNVVAGESGDQLREVRIGMDQGIAGWVATNKTAQIVNDVSKDPRFFGGADKATNFTTRSILAVPLVAYGKVLGVLEVVNKIDGEFTEEDLELFSSLADLVASAAMRLEMREERQKMMAQMIQTNRMTSLGLMVVGMAHEINTPNAAIKLAGQQVTTIWRDLIPILDRVADEEGNFILGGVEYRLLRDEIRKAADVIVRSAEKIDQVVKDLRNYNLGHRSGMIDLVNVTQVVMDALELVRAQGSYGKIQIIPDLARDLPPVRGNRYQLEQVITNLLLNGMQAISEEHSGSVSVRTGLDPTTGDIIMAVRDEGNGISPELLPFLLEPFFTTRIEQGGSGLGLYISNYIVTEHGGRLIFESAPGKGTDVTVALPQAKG